MLRQISYTYTIISSVILLCAVLSWIIPAGGYARETIGVNDTSRVVIIDHSFHWVEQTLQTWQVFSALFEDFERQAGIIVFSLVMGDAFQIMSSSRAIDTGVFSFLNFIGGLEKHGLTKSLGVNNVVISLVIILFSLFGSVSDMSEETLTFVIIVVLLAISTGCDSTTGLYVIHVAAHIGFSGAVLNPLTIDIAQGLSGLPLFSGFEYRMLCWSTLTTVPIVCVFRYTAVIKEYPEKSPMYHADACWRKRKEESNGEISRVTTRSAWIVYIPLLISLCLFSIIYPTSTFAVGKASIACYATPALSVLLVVSGWLGLRKSNQFFILTLLTFTILFLIAGVMGHGWYLPEIPAIFPAMGTLLGFANSERTDNVIRQFMDGVKDMLSAITVVGLAGGIIRMLQDGHITDPISHSLASLMGETEKIVSLRVMYLIQALTNLIIPSGSAKVALTMPIMAPFPDIIGLSQQAIVMAHQFGDGFTNMIIPISAVLMGALGVVRIPHEIWVKWFWKVLLLFIVLGMVLPIPAVLSPMNGF